MPSEEYVSNLEAENLKLRTELEELRKMEREISCVWCGHHFASTLGQQREALLLHASTCEKHPVFKLFKALEEVHRWCEVNHRTDTHVFKIVCNALGRPAVSPSRRQRGKLS